MSKKISLILFSHTSELDGAGRSLKDLVRELIEKKVSCYVVIPEPGYLKDSLLEIGCKVYVPEFDSIQGWWWAESSKNNIDKNNLYLNYLNLSLTFFEKIKKESNPNWVYSHTTVSPWGAVFAERYSLPHSISIREYGDIDHKLNYLYGFTNSINALYKSSDLVFGISHHVLNHTLTNDFDKKSKVIYSSISISKPKSNLKINEMFGNIKGKIFCCASTIRPEKGQLEFVKAAIETIKQGHSIRVLIVGSKYDKKYSKNIEKIINQSNLYEHFVFLEFTNNIYELLFAVDCVVNCSKNEALGRTIIEAGLLKKPTIISDSNLSIQEVYTNNIDALFYKSGSYEDLSKKIVKINGDDKLTENLIINSSFKIKKFFNSKNYGFRVYKEITNQLLKSDKRKSRYNSVTDLIKSSIGIEVRNISWSPRIYYSSEDNVFSELYKVICPNIKAGLFEVKFKSPINNCRAIRIDLINGHLIKIFDFNFKGLYLNSKQIKKSSVSIKINGKQIKNNYIFDDLNASIYISSADAIKSLAITGKIEFQLSAVAQFQLKILEDKINNLEKYINDYKLEMQNKENSEKSIHSAKNKLIAMSGYFDVEWYLNNNPDVAEARVDPYFHYVNFGKNEKRNRKPSYNFSNYTYILLKALYLKSPLNFTLKLKIKNFFLKIFTSNFGNYILERSNPIFYKEMSSHNKNIDYFLALPSIKDRVLEQKDKTYVTKEVDVIIPIYKGLLETKHCIHSVLKSKVATKFNLILINDFSPEPEINSFLTNLKKQFPDIQLLINKKNLGFVKSANLGMSVSNNDLILLNSDTEVYDMWIDNIRFHANSEEKIFSVTPFSNNAEIYSYPIINKKFLYKKINKCFYIANRHKNVEIPTAHGFCMYLRRDALNVVGFFDDKKFGMGYGEENDLSMRAKTMGWKNLIAADTFVYHHGSVSFLDTVTKRKSKALNILLKKYPLYNDIIQKYIRNNSLFCFTAAATAVFFKSSKDKVVLFVSHALSGGVKKHVEDQVSIACKNSNVILMTPSPFDKNLVHISIHSRFLKQKIVHSFPCNDLNLLCNFIKSFGVSFANIHHILGFSFSIKEFLLKLEISFDFIIHDYFLICPQTNLINSMTNKYCEEPDVDVCNACISHYNSYNYKTDVTSWRNGNHWYLEEADKVIVPSFDTKKRIEKYFSGEINCSVIPHERVHIKKVSPPSELSTSDIFRICILGAIGIHKGSLILKELINEVIRLKLPFKFYLVGYSDLNLNKLNSKYFQYSGRYDQKQLFELTTSFDPHLILFLPGSPETFSYTLSEALIINKPIAAPLFGSYNERLLNRDWTWLYDRSFTAQQLLSFLLSIYSKNFIKNTKTYALESLG